jgi:hypothetical protein
VLNQKERVRELDRQARQRWLDDAARRQTEKLAAVELPRDKLQGEKIEREKIREQERQRDDAAKRRVKAQLEAERGERSRLNTLAIVQQTQETWHSQDEARATNLAWAKRITGRSQYKSWRPFKAPGEYSGGY